MRGVAGFSAAPERDVWMDCPHSNFNILDINYRFRRYLFFVSDHSFLPENENAFSDVPENEFSDVPPV